MEIIVSINNQTSGRDKIARLIQYSSKALWYFIQQNRLSDTKNIEKIKRLEHVFSTFRKLLRFGRFIESFYGASKTLKTSDQLLKFTCTLSKLAFGMYLFCDHVICLEKTGLMEIQSQKWSSMSSRYWIDHKDIIVDTFKNLFDLMLPMSSLGYVRLSPGTVGLLGAFSSILGILPLIRPLFKLRQP
ncbi:Peroxisomal biogenesis factor 11 (PEX11) [Nesidiocoris tenuis]|uniref:Peroxisomal biogenesis factor 11 (PEX11) n=1 Tax=Nesidiocoris tenuis TaxID=355587 RepID=A0ABN7AJK3_9HEMI|nr:Peroxisomal biogenesis factor 11 (PEX11) [Nesidiocoris tenuis]